MKPDEPISQEELDEAAELARLLDTSPPRQNIASDQVELLALGALLRYGRSENELSPLKSAEQRRELCAAAEARASKTREGGRKGWLSWVWLAVPALGASLFLVQINSSPEERSTDTPVTAKRLDPSQESTRAQTPLNHLVEVQALALAERSTRPLSSATQGELDRAWAQYRGALLAQLEGSP